MELTRRTLRFLYRIRWQLSILPLIAVVIAWWLTQGEARRYDVSTTIYTGLIAADARDKKADAGNESNMANLQQLVVTEKTAEHVAIRLLARCLMYGDAEHDNNYIFAEHYRQLLNETPKEVLALVDKKNEAQTADNLTAYMAPKADNFIYRLLSDDPFFGIHNMLQRLTVKRIADSDMMRIDYESSDAGIAFNTLQILNEEFIGQYEDLRFGETSNVIKFYEEEVNRLYGILCGAEDDLIAYNATRQIVGNVEATKQMKLIPDGHRLHDNEQLLNRMSQRAAIDWIETQLGEVTLNLRRHPDFTQQLEAIARQTTHLCNLALIAEEDEATTRDAIKTAQAELEKQEVRTHDMALSLGAAGRKLSSEQREQLNRWAGLVIEQEEQLARMRAMDVMRQRLEEEPDLSSPLTASARKERHLAFIEQNYIQMLKALNEVRIRQRELQLSTATLRVVNPPMFPLRSAGSRRPLLLLLVFIAMVVAISAFHLLVDRLDHTLRDRRRAERLTHLPVVGCFPKENSLHHRKYNKVTGELALRQLSNLLLSHLDTEHPNVINLLSTSEGNGKTMLANELSELWTTFGLTVRRLTCGDDFFTDERRYIMARSVADLCPDLQPGEVLIIEYPSLNDFEVPSTLLQASTVSLLVTRANRTWKDIDQTSLNRVTDCIHQAPSPAPLFLYLTEAGRDAVEDFVGQLPPYSPFRNFIYRLSQLGFTATESN